MRLDRMRRQHYDATGYELDDFELMEEQAIEMMELRREEEERQDKQKEIDDELWRKSGLGDYEQHASGFDDIE
jgi:hypothetical protein